jgi:hypothetical protein
VFMLPAREMLGLHPASETITIAEKTTIDLDWVAHDIRKFGRLMTSHNGSGAGGCARSRAHDGHTALLARGEPLQAPFVPAGCNDPPLRQRPSAVARSIAWRRAASVSAGASA